MTSDRAAGFTTLPFSDTRIRVLLARFGAPALATLLPFALYVRTAPPTVYNIDSAELATAAATLGIPHPPGYPLHVLIGHAFTYLPFGDVGFRVNLMSAVFGALTLLLVYMIVMRLTSSRLSAIGAAWLLGFAYPFWSDAIVAEVYTLDTALVAGMVLFLLRWQSDRRTADLLCAFALLGLSFANRTTNVLNVPAVLLFLAPDVWREPWRVLKCAPAVLPGIALYALLPIRSASDAAYRWGGGYDINAQRIDQDLTDLSSFWWFVSARVFRPHTEWYGWSGRLGQSGDFFGDAWGALLGGGLIIAIGGLCALAAARPRVAALILGIGAVQTAFFINYAAIDKDTMFVHTYVVLAIGAGFAVARIAQLGAGQAVMRQAPAALAVLALLLIPVNLPLLDLSSDDRSRVRSEAVFAAADDDAVIIGGWTDIAPLEYLQIVENEREDVSLVLTWPIAPAELRAMIEHNLRQGRSVYAMRRNLTFWNIELNDFVWHPEQDWYRLALPDEEG